MTIITLLAESQQLDLLYNQVGCPRILMLLLRHGANVSARDGHGVTPLGIAAEHGKTEALDILIQHGNTKRDQSRHLVCR